MELAGPSSGHFFAGNDNELEFTVTENGTPIDVTGMTFRFVVARDFGVAAVLSTGDASASVAESDPSNGKFKASWTDTASASLRGTYRFQAQVEDLLGNKSNVHRGFLTFEQNLIP